VNLTISSFITSTNKKSYSSFFFLNSNTTLLPIGIC